MEGRENKPMAAIKAMANIMKTLYLLLIFFLLLLIIRIKSQSIIKTLPGYLGNLPFKLETGYISVGENDEIQLFYYFIESERDPRTDPLVFWLTGGPGCSGFSGLVYEIGPLAFDVADFDGSLPSLTLNPYSWTKIASIIFIDSPVGTGFSYSNTSQGYATSDTKSAKDSRTFLRKWLSIHPAFIKNRVYVAGDSYGGKMAPMVAVEIAEGNEAGVDEPRMSLQGYIVGNGRTYPDQDDNEIIPYAHRMGLISDEYYEQAKSSCLGEYVNPDPNNVECKYALHLIDECKNLINPAHILEPKCTLVSLKPNDDPVGNFLFLSKQDEPFCRNQNYVTSRTWANDETVQEALHIREGTITEWTRCNKSISYEENVESVVKYHQLLSHKGFQALVYSGDHDMSIPYMSTLKWIRQLNLTIDDQWRAWTVNGQIAGYTEIYKKNQAYLTFATIKGAGHTAPEYKPKECFAMFKRWLSSYPL